MISRNTIDKVFDAARVEEVIGDFVQLKKAGSNFKGLSPFSDERTPSFMVSPVKQIWKDFSTGKGGNAISFLMEHEHYSYPEAIKFLAKKYNVEIEETEQSDEQKEQANERESMYLVSEYARDYFQNNLFEREQGKAIGLSYFKERGYSEETIKKFQLGYSLNEWEAFTTEAINKGYNLKYLESTGLTIVKQDLLAASGIKQFDRFKGRVMFPIHSMSGRVLGFGGRILSNDKKAAKYLNSPESDIYHKSNVLYGIYYAKQSIAKLDNCFLVEGYTDVISFQQAGIENVVSSSGTALTENQIRLINRLTKNITILFDGDAAGVRASLRGIDLILEQGMNVKILTFPDGDDPDSFAKKVSEIELKEYLANNAQDFINFKVSLLMTEAQNDPVKKAGLIRDIVISISKIPDRIQQEVYIQECSRIMDISENVLFSELAQLDKKEHRELARRPIKKTAEQPILQVTSQTEEIDKLKDYEKEIIKILLLYGDKEVEFTDLIEFDEDGIKNEKKKFISKVSREIYLSLQEDEIEFTDAVFKEVYFQLINQLNNDKKIALDEFLNHPNSEVSKLVTDILMDDEKYILSDWSRKDISVPKKNSEEKVSKSVRDVILNIRRVLVIKKVDSILKEIEKGKSLSADDMINEYNNLKLKLGNELGRPIG